MSNSLIHHSPFNNHFSTSRKFMKDGKILPFLILLFVRLFGTNENIFAQRRKSPPKRNDGVKTTKIISVFPLRNLIPEQQRRLDTFNFVWQTIKSNYFDQTFSGLNWDKIKKEFEPRVLKTANDSQLHDILQEMITRLDRSHFAVIPPEVYQAIERAEAEAKATDEKQTAVNEEENSEEETIEKEDLISEDYSARFGIGIDLPRKLTLELWTRKQSKTRTLKASEFLSELISTCR
ncbi:MAG: hypothetical protein M3388_05140 [Acidobacteriota bacterium]|nr:hypothetical protein [Acidobacteriota bacterium]